MNKYEFVKEPGILLDAMFLLKLRFNGETAYSSFRGEVDHTEQEEKFYEFMRAKTADVSEKMLPLFYYIAGNDRGTPLLSFMRANWETLMQNPHSMIDSFCALLQDMTKLKEHVFLHYFPNTAIPEFNQEGMEDVRRLILESDFPVDVKLYLLDFFLSPESASAFIIHEFQKAVEIAQEAWRQNELKIENEIQNQEEKTMAAVCESMNITPEWCSKIYHTCCCVARKTISAQIYGDNIVLLYIGVRSDRFIESVRPETPIDFFQLGRCIYDETRLKILSMLRTQEMYCAEIARELGLKNNSTIYHLNMLANQHILKKRMVGNKLLYRINMVFFLALDEHLKNIIEEANILENDLEQATDRND